MTFIFDLGGYLPNRDHCIFARGKLSGLTLQDALDFAKENGIRRPDPIIRKVAESIARFREFATGCGTADEWIARKYIIRKGTEEYTHISKSGIINMSSCPA